MKILLLFITAVIAFDCSKLTKYDFQSIKGIQSFKISNETPPSETEFELSIGFCQQVKTDLCEGDACGIQTVKNGKDSIVSEVISFKDPKIEEDDHLKLTYDSKWGDKTIPAVFNFKCNKNANDFKLYNLEWNEQTVTFSLEHKAACIFKVEDSWGWFTWIFIFLVLIISFYVVIGAWFQLRKGNAIDFQSALKEVVQNFIDLLRALPSFGREIIEKISGGNRGEYSAV
ncbi:unnamed protein product [Candida verbasci]|uniref:Autophagy-related protein 27 n=1 Tax=Candida verbasci TaxID=1227364 RepID=A0A9W4XMA3_9ASCO|nr:unnamed protein product [Candida verbasci]